MPSTSTAVNDFMEKPSLASKHAFEQISPNSHPPPSSSSEANQPTPFAHLPPYAPPNQGLVSYLPRRLIPFAELMRLHKPAGYYAFYFPHLFGTLLAAVLSQPRPSMPSLVSLCTCHAVGSLFLRGAACTWNDTLDAPFDRQVARCRHRPVARGAVRPTTAHAFTLAQTAAWVLTLSWLPPGCGLPAALFAATMAIYPLCKRVTSAPQVVLGFSLALGQGIGIASVGLEPPSRRVAAALAAVYLANVVNAVVYDTVYAHQDVEDDRKAGVRSLAVACRGQTKPVLALLGGVEIALLAGAGSLLRFGGWYWAAAVGGTATVLGSMIGTVRLGEPDDCGRWFEWLIWFTGGSLCLGLLGEYAMRPTG